MNFKKALTCEKLLKDLEPHTPVTPSARPLLQEHKNPLKIFFVIDMENCAMHKFGKLLFKEL